MRRRLRRTCGESFRAAQNSASIALSLWVRSSSFANGQRCASKSFSASASAQASAHGDRLPAGSSSSAARSNASSAACAAPRPVKSRERSSDSPSFQRRRPATNQACSSGSCCSASAMIRSRRVALMRPSAPMWSGVRRQKIVPASTHEPADGQGGQGDRGVLYRKNSHSYFFHLSPSPPVLLFYLSAFVGSF